MLDMVFLAYFDYANIMTHWSYYLNKFSNRHSTIIAIEPHPYNYSIQHDYNLSQMSTTQKNNLLPKLLSAKFIVLDDTLIWSLNKPHYDARNMFRYIIKKLFSTKLHKNDITNKYYAIWHPGTIYRNNHNKFNYTGYNVIFTAPDLFIYSPNKQKTLTYYPIPNPIKVDLPSLIQSKLKNKIILHNPSDKQNKGSDIIEKVVNKVLNNHQQYKFILLTNLNYDQTIEWKQKSLIYLDLFSTINGIKSSFGLAGFEALLCGNITLSSINIDQTTSQQLNKNLDKNLEEPFPIINIGNDEKTFESVLENLLTYTDNQLEQLLTTNYHKTTTLLNGKTFTSKFLTEINSLVPKTKN